MFHKNVYEKIETMKALYIMKKMTLIQFIHQHEKQPKHKKIKYILIYSLDKWKDTR